MKDWTAIAKASGLDIPARDLERITQPLNAVEEAFRPLVASLPADLEPSPVFRPDEEHA